MNKKEVTATDVAKAAGVSQAAVSMILNKKYNVSFSRETIERVEEAARNLGYSMEKKSARQQSRMKGTIFVVCPNLNNPYYGMLIDGIEQAALKNRFDIFVCQTNRNLQTEEKYLKRLEKLCPSGIIYTCMPAFPDMVNRMAMKIPVVFIGEKNNKLLVDSIELDSRKPGSMIARYLLELGHRKAGYISTSVNEKQPARLRRKEGFTEEFENAGIDHQVFIKEPDEARKAPCLQNMDMEFQVGYLLTLELIREVPDITAIVGLNDMIALGIRDALLQEKYRIPKDISVVGCDNILASQMRGIDLTTVDHYAGKKGEDACNLLMQKMERQKREKEIMTEHVVHRVEYEPRLIIRGTSSYAVYNLKY